MNNDDMRQGIVPGVMAGYVFLAFAGSGMLDMVGGMIGAEGTPIVGFILHLVISIVIGALYTGVFLQYVKLGNPLMDVVVGGLIYGVIWWIIGGNIVMPAIAGGDLLALDIAGASFFGHIIFGHVLAFIVISMGGGGE